jgi:hypothetical protein
VPDWVTNGQAELMEGSQQRSWCWQRSWDPTPIEGVPVELEGSSMAIGGELDGATMLESDIRRIGEKIDNMSLIRAHERRIENEKIKQDEFSITKRMDDSYRLTESDFRERPLVPNRNPLRAPTSPRSSPQTLPIQNFSTRTYYPNERNGWA